MVGDNLYRKVFGNRDWHGPWHTHDRRRIQAVLPRLGVPLALLRGINSDLKLGFSEDTPIDKTKGVIQFFTEPGRAPRSPFAFLRAIPAWAISASGLMGIFLIGSKRAGVLSLIPAVLSAFFSRRMNLLWFRTEFEIRVAEHGEAIWDGQDVAQFVPLDQLNRNQIHALNQFFGISGTNPMVGDDSEWFLRRNR